MPVVLDSFGRNARQMLLIGVCVLSAASPLAAQSRNSGAVTITIDQAQVMKLPDGVATLVVGNPLIADVSVQAGGMAVLTGKGYGVTNLVALDRSGTVLEQKTIQVQSARDSVVVYRGIERESYSCMPKCERRITVGDSPNYFGPTLGQTVARTAAGQPQSEAKPK